MNIIRLVRLKLSALDLKSNDYMHIVNTVYMFMPDFMPRMQMIGGT